MHRGKDLQRTPLAMEAITIIPKDNFVQWLSPWELVLDNALFCVLKWNQSPGRSRVEA